MTKKATTPIKAPAAKPTTRTKKLKLYQHKKLKKMWIYYLKSR